MGTLRIAEHAKKRHYRLIDQVNPLLLSDDRDDVSHIVEPLDGDVPHRRNDRKVTLSSDGKPGLRMTGRNHCELAYDLAQPRKAAPAFLAAATLSGAPIAGDEETIALLTLARQVALSNIPVLIEGPTGTGKEVLARYLHDSSERRDGPFVAINCAAMPEAMLEAMLFGHRKGAFTGASEAQEGFFRAADGGTLLLDEIGEMPIALQAKLLRALQEGEVVPLGATNPISVDVRVVACTNRELPQEITAGRFREDLYYRLNVFPLRIPALRARPGDITPLAFAMLLRHSEISGPARWINDDAIELLVNHNWPGNVRELENVMRRAMLLAGDPGLISAAHIRFDQPVRGLEGEASPPRTNSAMPGAEADQANQTDDASLSDIAFRSESQAILRTLEECSGKRGETAKRLGISERTLRYRLATMRDAGLAIAGGRS
ncbi:sigma-54 interaction domain-containing protein [Qipengyuania sp. DGS5-3]|uniref:sigma-54 interaction domain-containing protein n=1 Tax=Qipengyuania sp. DGS5-3 TaxID=3349632 RepID=UPI0036D42D14